MHTMSNDQDIPPLEDCSELFTTPTPTSATLIHCSSAAQAPDSAAKDDEGFAGMKKGFLNRGKVSKKKASDDMPFIRPSKPSKTSNLQIPEVQEALKAPLLCSNEWVTDDLLHKIEANPKLAKHLTNPRMSEALQKFQTDQALAMKQYQNDVEVQEFIQEFCSIMGDHFEGLAEKKKSQPKGSISEEDKKIEKLLSNKEVQSALLDTGVQNFISLLNRDPEKAHRLLSQANAELKQKVQLLVNNGILAVQHT